jgi:hypothetical protein
MLVHHVVFWLKSDLSQDQKSLFVEKLTALKGIESLKFFQVGTPASTDRPVIDRSYSYSLMTVFENMAGHDVYQVHALHQDFLSHCKTLWEKVVIYDAE